MELSVVQYLVLFLVVALSAGIQGSIGFGFSFLAVPAFLLITPDVLPTAGIVLGLPMAIAAVCREPAAVDYRRMAQMTIGRLPGTVLGTVMVVAVPAARLSVMFGVLLLVAVLLSAFAPPFEAETGWFLTAGAFSGLMGTAAAVGGPPIGLVMQRHDGATIRATIGLTFGVGVCISLAALAISGQVRASQLSFVVLMLPSLAIGFWSSGRIRGLIDRNRLIRPLILAFAGVSAAAAVVQGIVNGP